jgi:hypothetical protein
MPPADQTIAAELEPAPEFSSFDEPEGVVIKFQ